MDAANGMAYLHSRGILHGELCIDGVHGKQVKT